MKLYKRRVNITSLFTQHQSPHHMTITCKRCGSKIKSYSPMRKWCVACRHTVSLEQARTRKNGKN